MLAVAESARQLLVVPGRHPAAYQGVSRLLAVEAETSIHGLALDQGDSVRRGFLSGDRPVDVSIVCRRAGCGPRGGHRRGRIAGTPGRTGDARKRRGSRS
eukprot:753837-Rhodomonas_salina.1